MIGISTILFDLQGIEVLAENDLVKKEVTQLTRRVSSTKTLDGSSYVNDFGFSVTDDNLRFAATNLSESRIDNFKRMIKLHSRFRISTKDGAFNCVFETLRYASGELNLIFIIEGAA